MLDLKEGSPVGEYRIERKIGEGGMGVVYGAVHPLIGKRAAIKVLKPELCGDPETVERFVDGGARVNQIGHPNIVDVFAFGAAARRPRYFVMEWLQRRDAARAVTARPLRSRRIADRCASSSRALERRARKGIVHRDLKPDNVFLVEVRDERRRSSCSTSASRSCWQTTTGVEQTAHRRDARHAAVHVARAGARPTRSITAPTSTRSA